MSINELTAYSTRLTLTSACKVSAAVWPVVYYAGKLSAKLCLA